MQNEQFVHLAFTDRRGEPKHTCLKCGEIKLHSFFGFVSFNEVGTAARSKGCYAAHPHCIACRTTEYARLKTQPLFSQDLRRFCGDLTSRAKTGADARRILFAIDAIDVLGMFIRQDGMCAITGLPMEWKRPVRLRVGQKNLKVPSIDRIDSSRNYTIDNVHLVMSVVNIMKNDLPLPAFVQMCRRIADHNWSL